MIVVTGVSDGLGKEVAKRLLGEGKKVIGLSRSQPSIDATYIKTDLANEQSIKNAANEILKMNEPLEALINCAGVMSRQDVSKLNKAEIERVFRVNTVGPMLLTSALIERLKKDKGDIVNVSSTVGLKAYQNEAAYGASKWAMRGFSVNLQVELKDTNCRVISFCCGGFNSKIFEKATGQKLTDPKNWMKAEDIAEFMVKILELPKIMEVSEVIINRRPQK